MRNLDIKDFYEREAKVINRYSTERFWEYRYHNKRMSILQRMLKKSFPSCNSFLDIGCGTGEYLSFSEKFVPYVVGIDISRNYLQRCASHRASNLVLCDSRNLPFKDQVFDGILCSEVIEHIKPHEPVIQEILRVSQKFVLISTPNHGLFRILMRCLTKQKLSSIDAQVGHINILKFKELIPKFQNPKSYISFAFTVNVFPPFLDDVHLPVAAEPLIHLIERLLDKSLSTLGSITIIHIKLVHNLVT